MDRFEETVQIYMSQFEDRISALYETFKPLIENRGLSTEVEFILPPNDFGIIGGCAVPSSGECLIVTCLEAEVSEKVGIESIERALERIDGFLIDVERRTSTIPKIDQSGEVDRARVLRDQFRKVANTSSEIKKIVDVIAFTQGKVPPLVRKKCRKVNGIRVEIIDIDDFMERSEANNSNITFSDLGGGPSVSLASSIEDHDLYMGVIPGITLARLFDQMGNTLLESNVRMFLGERGVNKGISQTIEENPLRFAAYNNGITMVSKDAVIEGQSVVSASDISIVNGGQTTVSIFKSFRREVDISDIQVPLKLVVIKTDEGARRKGLLESISRFSNTQNKVNSADRLAMDPPHPDLQESSKNPKFDVNGSGWFYERRRGEVTTLDISDPILSAQFRTRFPKENVMDATVLAKMWNSWWGSPEVGASGKTKAFETYHDQLQIKMHSKSWTADLHHTRTVALWLMYKHLYYYIGKNFGGLRGATLPHALGWFAYLTDHRLDLSFIHRKGKLPPEVESCLEMLVGPVDSLIREYVDGDQKEWSKKHDCTLKIRGMTPPVEYEETSRKLALVREGGELKAEDILPFLHEKGKEKIWDAFYYAKDLLGDAVHGSYLFRTMTKWPKLTPGGARVAIRIWNQASSVGYEEKHPGLDDFAFPEKRKK